MRYVTTCRWNGLDTGREVEIAEEHVSAFAGEIDLGILKPLDALAGPNVMTASHFLEDGPSWSEPWVPGTTDGTEHGIGTEDAEPEAKRSRATKPA